MRTKFCLAPMTVAVLVTALAADATARAMTPAPAAQPLAANVVPNQFETIAFSDSTEAMMLHQAYRLLATGDHDYKGHRVKAMREVEAAAKLLNLDLSGDRKHRTPQVFSDDQVREAQGLIRSVRNSAEVKDQDRITRHLDAAVSQLDVALATR